jgi:hypothetical protein
VSPPALKLIVPPSAASSVSVLLTPKLVVSTTYFPPSTLIVEAENVPVALTIVVPPVRVKALPAAIEKEPLTLVVPPV